jgi:hypothetical protein
MPRRTANARALAPPASDDDAVVEDGAAPDPVAADCDPAPRSGEPGAVGVREKHVVVLGQEPNRRGRLGIRPWRVREVEELAAILGSEHAELRSPALEHGP